MNPLEGLYPLALPRRVFFLAVLWVSEQIEHSTRFEQNGWRGNYKPGEREESVLSKNTGQNKSSLQVNFILAGIGNVCPRD